MKHGEYYGIHTFIPITDSNATVVLRMVNTSITYATYRQAERKIRT